MKTNIQKVLLIGAAVLSLSACAGSGFVPDSQAPRPYTAAHDIIDGQCRTVSLKSTSSNSVDKMLGNHDMKVKRCPQEVGGVEDPGGVQSQEER